MRWIMYFLLLGGMLSLSSNIFFIILSNEWLDLTINACVVRWQFDQSHRGLTGQKLNYCKTFMLNNEKADES